VIRMSDRPEVPILARLRLSELLRQLGTWLDLPDPGPTIASCAAAATVPLDGEEAAWLLNVAAPSAGKTEAVNLLNTVTNGRLNEITSAGLLGWSRGKNPHPVGILSRVPGNALVTFGDLSSLLATSDRGGRDQVFGLLRRCYDGHVTRDVTPPGGSTKGLGSLKWEGRLTVVAAVTNAIDRYSAHTDALGPRWLYVRAEDRPMQSRRNAAKAARQAGVKDARAEAIVLATDVITKARALVKNTVVPDTVADAIEDAVLVTCWGRAAVPRNGYGRREIEDVPIIEEPPRLIRQAHVLARGLHAIGLDSEGVTTMMRRIALDSMPAARLAVLKALASEDGQSTTHIARASGLHWNVAFRHCEDMTAVGVVDNLSNYNERDHRWTLTGEEGDLIRTVIKEAKGG
jgi:predicted transcriptional regulator